MGKKRKHKKRQRSSSSSSSQDTKKKKVETIVVDGFYLIQDDKEFLEEGSKREMHDLACQYREVGWNVVVMDQADYNEWVNRNTERERALERQKQDQEYREAAAQDAKKQAEKERLEKLRRDFANPQKRREIIAKSYELLFRK